MKLFFLGVFTGALLAWTVGALVSESGVWAWRCQLDLNSYPGVPMIDCYQTAACGGPGGAPNCVCW